MTDETTVAAATADPTAALEATVADTTPPTTTPTATGTTLLTEPTADPAKPEAKYTDFKLPEGFAFDGPLKDNATALFKDLGLNQEQAQKAVDFYAAQRAAEAKAPHEAYVKMLDDWRTEALAHTDLKGKLEVGGPVLTSIARYLNSLPQDLASAFRNVMDLTGAGNHQAFIRVLYDASKRLAEGGHVAGNGPSPAGQSAPGATRATSAAQAIFPNLPSAGAR